MYEVNWSYVIGGGLCLVGIIGLAGALCVYFMLSSKNKYRNINATNLATPGLFLVAVGAVIITLPTFVQIDHNTTYDEKEHLSKEAPITHSNSPPSTNQKQGASVYIPVSKNNTFDSFAVTLLNNTAKSLKDRKKGVVLGISGFKSDQTGKTSVENLYNQAVGVLVSNGISNELIERERALDSEDVRDGACYVVIKSK